MYRKLLFIPAALILFTQSISAAQSPDLPELDQVTSWLYLINSPLEPELVTEIADSDYDLVVLDFIPSEIDREDYPMAEVIEQLHNAPHPKLVIAYINIGEAESYRTYWQADWQAGNPAWILGDDPDGWEANYPVAYWHPDWQSIWLDGYLQAILDAGFDGVYMDWVLGYDDAMVQAAAQAEGVDPEQEMILWLKRIADFTRPQNLDFILIAQNVPQLAQHDTFTAIIDAVGQEQVWFDGGADNNPPGDCPMPRTEAEINSPEYYESLSEACRTYYDSYPDGTLHSSSDWIVEDLLAAQEKGLLIFTIDYALEPDNIAWIYETSQGYGFIPFVTSRNLDIYVPPYPPE